MHLTQIVEHKTNNGIRSAASAVYCRKHNWLIHQQRHSKFTVNYNGANKHGANANAWHLEYTVWAKNGLFFESLKLPYMLT